MSAYREHIGALVGGRNLDRTSAAALMQEVLGGQLEPAAVGALLTALASRPVTSDELAAFADVMRAHMIEVPVDGPCLDTCGTGGSGLPTLNTSTLAAFVVATAGIRVAKHGNRASSGRCGSLDVLEHLGVDVDLSPERAAGLLETSPFAFLNARRHHPALGPLGPIRRTLGFRTVFNFLGPVCNPARVTHQLLGVSDHAFATRMFEALVQLGAERLLVVVGDGGLDEIALSGPTQMLELVDGKTETRTFTPREVGLDLIPFDAIAGDGVAHNAERFTAILGGEERGPAHLHVALNAGAALYVGGAEKSIRDGFERAKAILTSGAAMQTFEQYREASRR